MCAGERYVDTDQEPGAKARSHTPGSGCSGSGRFCESWFEAAWLDVTLPFPVLYYVHYNVLAYLIFLPSEGTLTYTIENSLCVRECVLY